MAPPAWFRMAASPAGWLEMAGDPARVIHLPGLGGILGRVLLVQADQQVDQLAGHLEVGSDLEGIARPGWGSQAPTHAGLCRYRCGLCPALSFPGYEGAGIW